MMFGMFGILSGMNILIEMISQNFGIPLEEVIVQEGFLGVMAAAALGTAAVNIVSQIYSNKKERKNAKAQQQLTDEAALAQKNLNIAQASFQREQSIKYYGEGGLYRRQASDALSNAQQQYERSKEQVAYSWEQAQAAYEESLESLEYQKGRAEEAIDRKNLTNQASLGAFGVRGGSGRTRAGEVITNAREDLSFEYGQNIDRLSMELDKAEHQTTWAEEELAQSMAGAEQAYSYAQEQANMELMAAQKGYEFAKRGAEISYTYTTGVADLQYQAIKDQTNAFSVITAGLQGLSSGMQFASNLDVFGQQYLGWGQDSYGSGDFGWY